MITVPDTMPLVTLPQVEAILKREHQTQIIIIPHYNLWLYFFTLQ